MAYWIDLQINRSIDIELCKGNEALLSQKGLAPEISVR
jgi:hypothetical protein